MRTSAIAMGAVVAAALALVLAGLSAGATSSHHAALRLMSTAPLHVRGAGFQARERVKVVASAAKVSVTRHVQASARGSFAVGFSFTASHCSGLRVLAVGNAGSRAILKRPPLPACMPQ